MIGREYMYVESWDKCIDTLIKHIYMPSSNWNEEKSASMRYISRAYKALKRYDESEMWLKKAIKLTPYLREPYVELAYLYFDNKDYKKTIKYCEKALAIKNKSDSYINEEFAWNETPYDLLGLSYFLTGNKEYSLVNLKHALLLSPNDERIKKNYDIISKS